MLMDGWLMEWIWLLNTLMDLITLVLGWIIEGMNIMVWKEKEMNIKGFNGNTSEDQNKLTASMNLLLTNHLLFPSF